uniref:Uncharacterized protein n=1 Tax=Macaca fascicularis TaxID=9541 RepID=A0A7N9I9R7_MACFA
MPEILELPRDLLNGFDQNVDSDMDNEVRVEVVSDGDEELIGNWSKGHSCYALAKRLVAFCPYPGDLWNYQVERDDFGYLAEQISKQQCIQEVTWLIPKAFNYMCSQIDGLKLEPMFKRETEHKCLENLQPDHVVEKRNPFSGEEFQLATEICISNKEPSVNSQDNGENVSRLYKRPSRQALPSLAHKPKKKI